MSRFCVLVISCLILSGSAFGQEDTLRYKTRFFGLPVVFYAPETRLGFGAASILSFKTNPYDTLLRPSQVTLGGAYTLERQILFYTPFDIWLHQNDYQAKGELGYYKYFYRYYGNGNQTQEEETYDVTFPRVRAEFTRRVHQQLYAGVKYTFDAFNITEVQEGGILDQGLVTGADGGVISGLGGIVKYDNRNSVFYPSQGWYIEGSYLRFSNNLGSDYNYNLNWIDARRYFDFQKDRVLATQVYARLSNGNVPFYHLSLLGGNQRMRGYFEGRYRDKQLVGWQAEYRTPVFWRIGVVAFAGNAVVADRISNLQWKYIRTAVGGGLRVRIDRERKINLRLDYAFSREGSGFYVTIGEAF
ncbi:MAG: BamA/TamA family outer membrane protein [Fluviicola sp.]